MLCGVLASLARCCASAGGAVLTLAAGQLALHNLLVLMHPSHEESGPAVLAGTAMVSMHAVATLVTALMVRTADRALVALVAALRRVLPRRLVPRRPTGRCRPSPCPRRRCRPGCGSPIPPRSCGAAPGDVLNPSSTPDPRRRPGAAPHRSRTMSSSTHRRALRAGSVLTVAAAAVLLGAAPAFAHVTAQPGEAEQGGYTVINMRVPNESDTAGTIKLEITLPAEHPITGVRTTPVPGWTATMVKAPLAQPIESHGRTITEAVRTVTLDRNPGTRIGPGEFVEFPALARSAAHRHRPAGDPGGPDLRRRRGRRVGPAPDRRTRVGTPGSDGPPDPR